MRVPHIQKLFDEANSVKVFSTKYWYLRATYCEKMHDPTYSEAERSNCLLLHSTLVNRIKKSIEPHLYDNSKM